MPVKKKVKTTTPVKTKVTKETPRSELVPEVVLLSIAEVKPCLTNAKIHTPEQIATIAQSITKFGFRDPIAVDENKVIVEGHGRVEALKSLGAKTVPSMILYGMSDNELTAYRVFHNKSTLSTEFDIGMLTQELHSLEGSGLDLELTGFTALDLGSMDLMLEEPEVEPEVPATEQVLSDKVPEEKTEKGQLQSDYELQELEPVYQYTIVFDSKAQQITWLELLSWIKTNCEGTTIASRLETAALHLMQNTGGDGEGE